MKTSPASQLITGQLRRVDRVVMAGLLVSLLVKLPLFVAGFVVYRQLPLHDPFFPRFLQSSLVYISLYLAAVFLVAVCLVIDSRRLALAMRVPMLGVLFLLCIHQQTYNDVTFVTCFWTAAWSTWLIGSMSAHVPERLLELGVTLSHVVLSMVFLGAAVGKLTPGYWNGDVLHGIYFESRNFWFFNLARSMLGEGELVPFARWYSRGVLGMELLCSLIWLMPQRVGSLVALATLIGITVFSNPYLISVVGCLMGLSLVGILVPPPSGADSVRV